MKPLLILLLASTLCLQAQNQLDLNYHLPQNINYDANIPTPKSIIGHEVGEWHVTHDKLVAYMKALAEASDRIQIEKRGTTFEGRPLLLLTITAPENHQNIDNIRAEHLKLTMPNESKNLSLESMPTVIYQGFSIHGNEPSGSNASMIYAYYLAAAQGDDIDNYLKNTIILLDPSFNPDGLQRFAYWANTNKSANLNPDSNDREYHEVWPGGRTNHYWFDMNRDWLPVQLPESQARIKTFNKWMPNVLTDHHEMGTNSTFFFQPGIQSRVHPLTPKANQELTMEIGNFHAEALDNIGSLYFTEERYDDYYYGKGSTFPDINGAIGILFEQASARGHAQMTDNGLLTFPFAIRNQFTTAVSTLKAANTLRSKLLKHQQDFYSNQQQAQSKNKDKAIVFGNAKDQARTNHLAEILKRHEIEVYKLKADMNANGKTFKKENSYLVPINQTKSTVIKAMFETRTTFQDSLFYDISAWTFPMAFNLDYAYLSSENDKGVAIKTVAFTKGKVTVKSRYAYLMEWHEYYTPKALNQILNKGIRAKVGLKPFSLNGQNFDYGTILIPVQNQQLSEDEIFTALNEIAKNSHVDIIGVDTGLTQGIDLGSSMFKTLKPQKVAMLVGNGFTPYDAGEIWHLFDQRYDMHLTKLDVDYFSWVDLSAYTTIILPNYRGNLNDRIISKLKTWTQNGGTLIAYENTAKLLSKNKFIKLDFETNKLKAKNISFEQKADFRGAQYINGSIFETKLDRSHPINFGYTNNRLPLFKNTTLFVKPDSLSYNNPIKFSDQPLLSGYISKPNLEILKNTVPFQVQRLGAGKVVAFTDNTNFRAFWYGTNKLLMNAIFFAEFM
jgi:hypothetical protein